MSSRALRKLGGKDDILPKADEDEDDSLVVDVRNTGAKPKMVNPFNLVSDTNSLVFPFSPLDMVFLPGFLSKFRTSAQSCCS